MDIVRPSASEVLVIECPRCRHTEDDDYEVTPENALQSMRCVGCGVHFYFAVMDCAACGAEHFFGWEDEPGAETVQRLTCSACNRPYVEDEDTSITDELF